MKYWTISRLEAVGDHIGAGAGLFTAWMLDKGWEDWFWTAAPVAVVIGIIGRALMVRVQRHFGHVEEKV